MQDMQARGGRLLSGRSADLTVLVRQLLQLCGVFCAPLVKHVDVCLEHTDVGAHLQVWQKPGGERILVSVSAGQACRWCISFAAGGSAGVVKDLVGVPVIASMGVSAELPVGALVCSERWLTLLNHPGTLPCMHVQGG